MTHSDIEGEAPGGPSADAGSPKTVLVLGGGGMKGIAHIGVMKALEESGIRPDAIVGTSIGALVGALVAGGLGWRELSEVARRLRKEDVVCVNRRARWLGGVRAMSMFDDGPFRDWMDRILPTTDYSELLIPLRFNATSLVTGGEVWFGTGQRQDVALAPALYASCALPLYFPPAAIDGDLLVDGGVLNTFPMSEAVRWRASRVVGVDVGSDFVAPPPGFFEQGMIAIHDRVFNLQLQRQRLACIERFRDYPGLYIRPAVGHHDTFDFERTEFFMEEGYRAARESIRAAGWGRSMATATPVGGG